jgi:diacylglycerol kinase
MSIKRFFNSFKYAFWGIKKVLKTEQTFQIDIFAIFVVSFLSIFIFKFNYIELSITFLCMALVLVSEIINTAIEHSWNHLEPNHHPVVKTVKDMMAGASAIASIFSAIIWAIIIWKHFS